MRGALFVCLEAERHDSAEGPRNDGAHLAGKFRLASGSRQLADDHSNYEKAKERKGAERRKKEQRSAPANTIR